MARDGGGLARGGGVGEGVAGGVRGAVAAANKEPSLGPGPNSATFFARKKSVKHKHKHCM